MSDDMSGTAVGRSILLVVRKRMRRLASSSRFKNEVNLESAGFSVPIGDVPFAARASALSITFSPQGRNFPSRRSAASRLLVTSGYIREGRLDDTRKGGITHSGESAQKIFRREYRPLTRSGDAVAQTASYRLLVNKQEEHGG
ncbi:MAG: hypothetical protein AB7H90_24140 [Alphaproteobacteria bacterium]